MSPAFVDTPDTLSTSLTWLARRARTSSLRCSLRLPHWQQSFIDSVSEVVILVGMQKQVPTGSRTENSGSALASVHRQRVGYSSYATDTGTCCATCAEHQGSHTPVVGLRLVPTVRAEHCPQVLLLFIGQVVDSPVVAQRQRTQVSAQVHTDRSQTVG